MKPDQQQLQEQLNTLKERLPGLSSRLSQAAVELKEAGVPIDERLMELLIAYRRDFTTLRSQLAELTKNLSVPGVVPPSQVSSLHDIQGILHTIARSGGDKHENQKAVQILDRFLSITHREQSDFAPLQEAKVKVRELRSVILNSSPSNFPGDVPALDSGQHPCCALLTLMDSNANVDDDTWGILVEVAARAFGKPLTVAATRGKLELSDRVSEPVSRQVAPQVTPQVVPQVAPQVTPQAAPTGRRSPEMVVIAGSGEVAPTDTEAEVERLLSQNPPRQPSNLPDVIVLPSFDESQQEVQMPSRSPIAAGGSDVGLKVLAHIERFGDRQFQGNEFAGTRGKALRLEGFAIALDPPIPGLGIRYMAHLQGKGDTPWVSDGEFVGTRGAGVRLEGFAIELTGPEANNYNVHYMAHIERVGDTPEVSNGEYCGRRGTGWRVEGIKVRIERK